MIIAEVAVFPTSEGSSVSRYVAEVIKVFEASGLKTRTGPMATSVEAADLESLFRTVVDADAALVRMGVGRIHIDLRVDHRLDKDATMASKLAAVGKR